MSVFSKVLLFLNLFVALFLLFLTGSIVSHRHNWTKRLDDLKQVRDGIQVDELLVKLEKQDPEQYRRVTNELQSRHARRAGAGRALTKEQPLSEEARKFLGDIGPDEYKRIVQRVITAENPKLIIEERELATRKTTLAGLRDGYQTEVIDLTATIARHNTMLKDETDYEKRVQAENADRRREIAQLYMELEEAVASRDLARSQERDMRHYLDLTRKHIQELLKKTQEQLRQISGKEIAGGGKP